MYVFILPNKYQSINQSITYPTYSVLLIPAIHTTNHTLIHPSCLIVGEMTWEEMVLCCVFFFFFFVFVLFLPKFQN